MLTMIKRAACVVSIAWLAACASSPPMPLLTTGQQQAGVDHLEAYIRHEMDAAHVPGLSIAVVSDQQVLWAQGWGWADQAKRVPADAHTVYRAGSLSKLFTTAAALQLAEQGRLPIDQPLQAWWPHFTPQAPDGTAWPITPRMLMTHHSGLPRDVLQGFMGPQPEPFERLLGVLPSLGADDRPNRAFAYSNVGMSVLGTLVAQTAGQPFEHWMQAALLQPLGMNDSTFEATHGPRLAQGHVQGQAAIEPGLRDVPAGGLSTSVHDLARFLRMLLAQGQLDGRTVLAPAQVQAMFTVQNADVALDAGFRVGLGWMLDSLSLGPPRGVGVVAHHAGATPLFSAQTYLLPQQKLAVVVMANDQQARQLVDKVALRALAVFLQTQADHHSPPIAPSPWADDERAQTTNRADHDARRWAGDYVTLVGPVRLDQRAAEDPVAQAMGLRMPLRLHPDGGRSLTLKVAGLWDLPLSELGQIEFKRTDIDGVAALVGQLGDSRMLLGSRVPPAPIPDDWRSRVGRYEVQAQAGETPAVRDLALVLEGGWLRLRFTDASNNAPQERLVRPINDHEALMLTLLPDAGPRLRWAQTTAGDELRFSGLAAIRRDGH
ncbi:MAG: hypothetical protein RI907_386 [Pseudomonadota bacterium]|jgi:CubicO group peptidase (beta-lactamase class C family)